MISAFLNTVKIPELRRRILFTLAVIVLVRLGAAITTPGVNQGVLQEWFRTSLSQRTGGGLAALFNLFSGGALENCAVFSLGIMPYISASIMMQLLTAVIPRLGRLAREDGGRQKIMQLTRYTTLVLCIFQGYLLALSFQHPESYHTMLPGITAVSSCIMIDALMYGMIPRENTAQFSKAPPLNKLNSAARPPPVRWLSEVRNHSCKTP